MYKRQEVHTSTAVGGIDDAGKSVTLADGTKIDGDAVVVASGYDIFPAEIKEEYGYGIYDNVFTTVDIERMFKEGGIRTADGKAPKSVAFLHCVGSRDEKVGQRHCSRVDVYKRQLQYGTKPCAASPAEKVTACPSAIPTSKQRSGICSIMMLSEHPVGIAGVIPTIRSSLRASSSSVSPNTS